MVTTLHSPQAGCFVFKVVDPKGLAVRCSKVARDGDQHVVVTFGLGQLIEVDWIEGSNDGRGLRTMRLANGYGWFDATKDSVCEAVTVDDGLWTFFSFGIKSSVFVFNQPTDRKEHRLDQILWPLQRVFCDKKVKGRSGKTFYRIQGTHDWVVSSKGGDRTLYPEALVSTGLKAFVALEDLEVLTAPTDDVTNKTGRQLHAGNLVAVDHSIVIPNDQGNGPYLRLADNSGWLMVSQENVTVMKEVEIQDGCWDFQVANLPGGITLRAHPIDTDDYFVKTETKYSPLERIQCDKEVHSPDGVIFYRVKGTTGWLPDRRFVRSRDKSVERHMLHVIEHMPDNTVPSDTAEPEGSDDEVDLRQAFKDLECNFWTRRNQMLRKIHKLDALHTVNAFSRSKEQISRSEELVAARSAWEEANAKSVEEQLRVFQKRRETEQLRKRRGDMFEFKMFCESEIRLDKSDLMFAMGGTATLAVNESRILRYTSGLPRDLASLLENEALALPLASVVALGSEDRYFIRFANERMERWCVGNDELEEILMAETADFVAFGAGCQSYVVKSSSGIRYNNIPEELETILNEERPIHSVSLGPSGEYFVAWEDGACSGGNWDGSRIDAALDRLKGEGWHVRDLKFGDDHSFIIRYSDYDGPF
jgi:hypothetical protein